MEQKNSPLSSDSSCESLDTDNSAAIAEVITPILEDPDIDSQHKAEIIGGIILSMSREVHVGPIPSPEVMFGYEKVIPGAANRILEMAERQSAHRIELEKIAIPSQLKESARGQMYGFILAIMLILAGVGLTVVGYSNVGITIFSITILSLAGLFINGKIRQRREDNPQKKED